MADKTARGIRYPEGVDLPAFPDDFDRMAGDIDDLLPRVGGGTVGITGSANTPTSKRVEFEPGLFTETPNIVAQAISEAPGRVELVSYSSVSMSGADIYLRRTTSNTNVVRWMAFQNGGGPSYYGWQRPQYDGASNTKANPTRYLNSLQKAVQYGLLRADAGRVDIPGGGESRTVEFKEGLFPNAPWVFVTAATSNPQRRATASSITGSSMEVHLRSPSDLTVYWIALFPTSKTSLWTPGGPADLAGAFKQFAENADRLAPRIDSGFLTVPGGGTHTEHIEFESGLFSEAPSIAVTAGTTASTVKGLSASFVTATGADIHMERTSNVTTGVRWLAVQP